MTSRIDGSGSYIQRMDEWGFSQKLKNFGQVMTPFPRKKEAAKPAVEETKDVSPAAVEEPEEQERFEDEAAPKERAADASPAAGTPSVFLKKQRSLLKNLLPLLLSVPLMQTLHRNVSRNLSLSQTLQNQTPQSQLCLLPNQFLSRNRLRKLQNQQSLSL